MNRKFISIEIVCFLIFMGFLGFSYVENDIGSAYTPHDPIHIDGNSEFTAANGVTGGSGTPSDPYIIEDWDISVDWDCGIEIWNTNAHFIIRNVYVHGTSFETRGVYLSSVENGAIESSLFTEFYNYAMGLWNCLDITISSNVILNNSEGIYLTYCDNIIIKSNDIWYNYKAIMLYGSSYIDIFENDIKESGIEIKGSNLVHFNSHNITINNTVNDKPVYYHKNQTKLVIDNIPLGQLLLANCSDVLVSNINITKTAPGVLSVFTNNVSFAATNLNDNIWGIYILYSNDNTVGFSNFTRNSYGIMVRSSTNTSIHNNNFISNGDGIRLYFDNNNTIIVSNYLEDHWEAILVEYSKGTTIKWNEVVSNRRGVLCYGVDSDSIRIECNNISRNEQIGIQFYSAASGGTFINNKVSQNEIGFYFSGSWDHHIINNSIFNNWIGVILVSDITTNITIMSNDIYNNGYCGVNISESTGNSIYHNNFFNNYIQALDSTSSNQWDDGYPSGGNYWSDYTGFDNFSGINQDIPGSDGIGDTNYSLDNNSADEYPLMLPVGKYLYLYEGWNLISIPFIQLDSSMSFVLSSINGYYDAVQWYDARDISDPWEHYHISKPFHLNDLSDIHHKMGFWIHITEPGGVLFQYYGTQPTSNQTIILYPGWNLVGYPSLRSYNRTQGLNNLTFGQEIDSIWTYDATTQKWEDISPSDHFELGRGYWIHAKTTCVWEVPI